MCFPQNTESRIHTAQTPIKPPPPIWYKMVSFSYMCQKAQDEALESQTMQRGLRIRTLHSSSCQLGVHAVLRCIESIHIRDHAPTRRLYMAKAKEICSILLIKGDDQGYLWSSNQGTTNSCDRDHDLGVRKCFECQILFLWKTQEDDYKHGWQNHIDPVKPSKFIFI